MSHSKPEQFRKAIEHYQNKRIYQWVGHITSTAVVTLQCLAVYHLGAHLQAEPSLSVISVLFTLCLAYVITDFVNGFIHMLMDNNTHYTSAIGPLIAAFHMHHKTPKYRNKSALLIYFHESGAKIWLPFYLLLILYLQSKGLLSAYWDLGFTALGILSSFAELSHYWCHNATDEQRMIRRLQAIGILLSKEHHRIHHVEDNTHYAFLNGISDGLLNVIARLYFKGYKQRADLHARAYHGAQTANRS